MAIYYRKVTYSDTQPSSPALGEKWIRQIGDSYQAYTWLNNWIPLLGGGGVITETDNDTHYMNVIIQETPPDSIIKPGWSWIKQSILQEYLYIWDYVLIAGA